MVLKDRSVTSVGGYIGFMGEPFEVRDPTAFLLQAHLPPQGSADKVLATIDEELERLAEDGLAAGELARTQARIATHLLRETDAVIGRALRMAVLELQRSNRAAQRTAARHRRVTVTLRPARRALGRTVLNRTLTADRRFSPAGLDSPEGDSLMPGFSPLGQSSFAPPRRLRRQRPTITPSAAAH
jgi:hypothetical protein